MKLCEKLVGNFRPCGKPAHWRQLQHNKQDFAYFCDSCAKIVRSWQGSEPLYRIEGRVLEANPDNNGPITVDPKIFDQAHGLRPI